MDLVSLGSILLILGAQRIGYTAFVGHGIGDTPSSVQSSPPFLF